jgi:hypothetical protein
MILSKKEATSYHFANRVAVALRELPPDPPEILLCLRVFFAGLGSMTFGMNFRSAYSPFNLDARKDRSCYGMGPGTILEGARCDAVLDRGEEMQINWTGLPV